MEAESEFKASQQRLQNMQVIKLFSDMKMETRQAFYF